MSEKNIFIKKSEINVSVVKVGTKKLTKSLLQQINYWFPFDYEYNFKGDNIFGYAKIFNNINREQNENHIVIGIKNDNLYKFDLNNIEFISRFKPDATFKYLENNYKLENLCGGIDFINPKFLNDCQELDEDYIPSDTIEIHLLTKEGLINVNRKVNNVESFLKEIYKYQVYI